MMRLIAVLLIMAVPTALFAQNLPAFYDITDVQTNDTLNVRTGPGTEFEVLDKLPSDTTDIEVVATNDDKDWGLINLREQSGWVSMRYLRRQGGQPEAGLPGKLMCAGTEPFWSFAINPDRSATFSRQEQELSIENVLIVPSENRTDRHALFADGGEAVITSIVGSNICSDLMSDRTYGLSIDLLLTDAEAVHVYSGCCALAQ